MTQIPDDIQDKADEIYRKAGQLSDFLCGMNISQLDALKICTTFTLVWMTERAKGGIPIPFIRQLFKGIHTDTMNHLDLWEKRLKGESK